MWKGGCGKDSNRSSYGDKPRVCILLSFPAHLALRLSCYEKLCSIFHRGQAQVGRSQIRSSAELSAKVSETPGRLMESL